METGAMTESDFMLKATHQDKFGNMDWLAILAYADALEDDGKQDAAFCWRWVGENCKRPLDCNSIYQWFCGLADGEGGILKE